MIDINWLESIVYEAMKEESKRISSRKLHTIPSNFMFYPTE